MNNPGNTGNVGNVGNTGTLKDATAMLDRFKDHNTYGAAIKEIGRVFQVAGPAAGMAKARNLRELFEDVYLSAKLG